MRKVVVAGVGQTAFGKFTDRSVRSLAEEALQQALENASIDASRIGVVYFANALSGLITGQETIRGQVALRHTPLMGTPILNIDNACASGSSAFNLAWLSVASGQVDVALALGAEKLTHEDKAVTFGAFASGVDVEERQRMMRETPGNRSLFMDIYAARTRKYMAASGATAADFAAVCMKSRRAASFSPWAQFKDELSESDILNARVISAPLTLPMCSPIADGAAAAIVVSESVARQLGCANVEVRASKIVSATRMARIRSPPSARVSRPMTRPAWVPRIFMWLRSMMHPRRRRSCSMSGLVSRRQIRVLSCSGRARRPLAVGCRSILVGAFSAEVTPLARQASPKSLN